MRGVAGRVRAAADTAQAAGARPPYAALLRATLRTASLAHGRLWRHWTRARRTWWRLCQVATRGAPPRAPRARAPGLVPCSCRVRMSNNTRMSEHKSSQDRNLHRTPFAMSCVLAIIAPFPQLSLAAGSASTLSRGAACWRRARGNNRRFWHSFWQRNCPRRRRWRRRHTHGRCGSSDVERRTFPC